MVSGCVHEACINNPPLFDNEIRCNFIDPGGGIRSLQLGQGSDTDKKIKPQQVRRSKANAARKLQ